MGDDRHGRSPRPGDRAPWERYPTEDNTERDGGRTSRRSRHTDATADPGAAPLTVQDLVQKVDNERSGRRGRRAAATPEAAAPAPHRGPRRGEPEAAAPSRGARRGEPETPAPNRGVRRGEPPAGSDPAYQRPAEPAQRRPAEPTRRQGEPPRQPDQAARRQGDPAARRPAAPGRPTEQTPRRSAEGPPPRTAGSPVVQDITGTPAARTPNRRGPSADDGRNAPAPTRGKPETAEEVTDILPPLAETTRAKRKKTDDESGAAQPKSVGAAPLSRLAASKQRRNKRLRLAGRSALAMFAVLCLLTTGGGWSYLRSTGNNFTQISAIDNNTDDVVDSNAQLGDENYLLVGTDTRAGVNSQVGAGTLDDAEGSRADTVMLVNIPKNRSRVVVVSFPRDLDVTRPQCNGWDNEKVQYTAETFPSAIGDKLNAVYALGGPKCLFTTIQRMTGSAINHFIAVDFAGFEAMVDQIGGVEVCAPKPITDEVLGTVLEHPGKQKVDGSTALNYVRARHVYGEERSDYDRINRQQRFMASLLRGALSSKVLFDPGKLNGFIGEFTKHTWVDKVQPSDLLTLGRSLQKLDAGTVTFLTIPTAGTTSYGNEIPREQDIKAIFKAIRDDQPLPGEKKVTPAPGSIPSAPPAPPKLNAVDPSTVSLLVSNASGTSGLAQRAATKLGNQGFQIFNIGNYSGGSEVTSKVRYGPGQEAAAATVASSIPGALMESASDLGGIVEVVIGGDFTGTVRAPTPVGDVISNVPATTAPATPVTLPSDLEHVNAADETCK
ncbi:LCP family protein [Nocardia sp. CS682]|uniref:LCP family protein n=2 Tax=Nocardia TaxID=1817 RepID=UPI001074D5BB|nr:LCP family protein [Nocardia sp. CS682]QBS42766.1 transcriptional regulator [Nocardia sp. CS682]